MTTTADLTGATLYLIVHNFPGRPDESEVQGYLTSDVAGIVERIRLLETSKDDGVRATMRDERTRVWGERWNGEDYDEIDLPLAEFRTIAGID